MLSPILHNAIKKRWKMSSTLLDDQQLKQNREVSTSSSLTACEKKKVVFVEPQTQVKGRFQEAQKVMGPLSTPKKGPEAPGGDPWTPTSNLKMLISAASPEIRNREKEKKSSEETENSSQQDTEQGEESERLQLSRKEKSLGLLCHKFLARYPDHPNPAVNNDICLDDVAIELNVERRRIYDIMNVLESLNMVSRLAKNRYTWHGRAQLAQTLALLQREGEKHHYNQQIQQIRQRHAEDVLELEGEEKENEDPDGEIIHRESSFSEASVDAKGASRKDKSLRVMSQKFVMLFLVSSPRVVSLEIAAKILIGEDQVVDQDKSKFKTKIRRLYDISNVLSSLKLIKKVHVTEERGRKPAFKWTGPENLLQGMRVEASSRPFESRSSVDNCTKNLFSSPSTKRGFTRHPSLVKLAKSIEDDRRKINSAPSSPIKIASDAANGSFFSSKMDHLAAICKMQLDQQAGNVPKQSNPKEAVHLQHKSSVLSPCPSTMTAGTDACPQTVQLSFAPPPCCSFVPVLLPHAVYVTQTPVRPRSVTRPLPSSTAVRSMTFESPRSANPKASPASVTITSQRLLHGYEPASPALKRTCLDSLERSPAKIKRNDVMTNSKSVSPKLCEILQARLKDRRGTLNSSRASARALHLEPEFTKTPHNNSDTVEHSMELPHFLETEERDLKIHNQATPTLQDSTGHTNTETLIPTGYLIPITQQPLLSFKETLTSSGETNKTPTYIYQTPNTGSEVPSPQEFTPSPLPIHRPTHRVSPNPSFLNFTLQNLALIHSTQTTTHTAPANEQPSPVPCTHAHAHTPLQTHGMIFIKPVSPLTLISLQQPALTTPKSGSASQTCFFHTPVSTVVTSTATKSLYIPQRKLDVSSEEH
ncbi:transcription factor E2F8 isoform X1 [Silurus meridionalis]|uniref:Transcription factor E2F8 n=2 Tax=Silurus meridionalis TaxID=175797 RepID=A0A8T0BED0_SILME|nr:transcription factor E2F8 isoform X1 [Silurus meridionalis]KAF7703580.1 hypothetical protein HF521_022587 [Silurus meridionalis]